MRGLSGRCGSKMVNIYIWEKNLPPHVKCWHLHLEDFEGCAKPQRLHLLLRSVLWPSSDQFLWILKGAQNFDFVSDWLDAFNCVTRFSGEAFQPSCIMFLIYSQSAQRLLTTKSTLESASSTNLKMLTFKHYNILTFAFGGGRDSKTSGVHLPHLWSDVSTKKGHSSSFLSSICFFSSQFGW